jgi:lipoate-protein ligase A
MQLLKLTLPTPAENLALDEALIETAESVEGHPEVLRLWEPRQNFVVIGRSSSYSSEVNHDYCGEHNIPVLRRITGGASIVTGPGCLMYGVLLDYRKRPQLRMLDQAHQFVMQNMADAVGRLGIETDVEGICDLTVNHRKVSGNSLRCKRNWMLYHGTMICDFDRSLIGKCLDWPKRTPDYRKDRPHDDFVGSIATTSRKLGDAIRRQWATHGLFTDYSMAQVQRLVQEKYRRQDWHQKVS